MLSTEKVDFTNFLSKKKIMQQVSVHVRVHNAQCGKTRNSLSPIFFREINYLVIYLVNALLSRNFCQKGVRVNFRNFHSVHLFRRNLSAKGFMLYIICISI